MQSEVGVVINSILDCKMLVIFGLLLAKTILIRVTK